MRQTLLTGGFLGLVLMGILGFQALQFDPYSSLSQVEFPFSTSIGTDGQISLQKNFIPTLVSNSSDHWMALARTGLRIPLYDYFFTERPLQDTASHIIEIIHQQRFDPRKPYVITGGHYSDLYVRNLGIFFNALLDPRLGTSLQDWQNRQRIALQTVAYDLAFIDQNGAAVTTIAPTGKQSFTGLNIYAPPSDSLFSILFTLKALQTPDFLAQMFPPTSIYAWPLETQSATQSLLSAHTNSLGKALDQYLDLTIDPQTGLVRKEVKVASARDGISRESSFYDNVIAWSTVQLADELGIHHQITLAKDVWKQKIMDAFWDDQLGIFKNDLSNGPTVFSADSLIVTSTGFLDLSQPSDRDKLNRILSYIQTQQLDQPFPLRYTQAKSPTTFQLPVELLAKSYMQDAIWSHWGMEYIKALLLLKTDHPEYQALAQKYLDIYTTNIEKSGGYPEVYNSNGTVFSSILVKSVLDTGWVVNYEQAKMMAGM